MTVRSFLSKNFYLKAHDMLTGNSVHDKLSFLLHSQFWDKANIIRFQEQKFKKLLKFLNDNNKFYRDKMKITGLNPDDIKSLEDLSLMPIVTKQELRNNQEIITSRNIAPKMIMRMSSSGSTGEPLFYLNTKEAYSMNIASNLRGWYWMGYKLGDKYIKLSQNPRNQFLKRLQDFMSNNQYLATNPLNQANFEFILGQIETYRPTIIRSYPDPLLMLARERVKHDRWNHVPLALTTTGNTLFPETRKEIEEAFGCKIFDSYSCEGNANVFECATHECYHVSDEYGISEVLDSNGMRIDDGIGRLVSTDLWNYAQPFIRYETQDLVEVSSKPCECGRHLTRINRIIGRDNDTVTSKSGRMFIVHNFTGFFQTDQPEINRSVEQFQIVKAKDGNFRFNLVVNQDYDYQVESFIKRFWEKELQVKVTIHLMDTIPLNHNNKRKFIIDEGNINN